MSDLASSSQPSSSGSRSSAPESLVRSASPLRRIALGCLALLSAGVLAAELLALFDAAPSARALPQETATVIVQFDDNARVARAIAFTDPISGIRALELAGLNVVISDTSFGPAICAIEGVGCPSSNCFCGGSTFWGNSYHDGTLWQSYSVGASSSVISQTGAIEGWRWGEWGSTLAEPEASQSAVAGLNWLSAQQVITSGGFGRSMGAAVEGMLAFGANHIAAEEVRRSATGPSLADFATLNGATYSRVGAAESGKLATALQASDACLPAGALLPSSHYSPTLGSYAAGTGATAWAILGASAASETVEAPALVALRAAQQSDGGWEWSAGWGSDTNSTALAIQALVANDEPITSTVILSAVAYLAGAQSADGGFPYAPGATAQSDANSTAYVIQGLIAAGEDPEAAAWEKNGATPVAFLRTLQLPSGAFEWTAGTGGNLLATTQAIPALLGRAHPIAKGVLAVCPVSFLPAVQVADVEEFENTELFTFD